MKNLLFDIYKVTCVWFHQENANNTDMKPNFLERLVNCTFVVLFLLLIQSNIYAVIEIFLTIPKPNPGKPLSQVIAIFIFAFTYTLLFKVLGLKNIDYYQPEHRPSNAIIKRVRLILIINAAIFALLTIVEFNLR